MVSPVARPHAERIFGLDVLRAAAIVLVLLGHTSGTFYGFVPYSFYLGGTGGWGVELFFVLSGFLIGGLILKDAGHWREGAVLPQFYLRRWLRTLPLFWFMLAANVAIEYAWHKHRVGWGEALEQLFFLRNFRSINLSFMSESWSLAVEEWFYLLFPAVLWLVLRRKFRFGPAFLAVAAGFWVFSLTARIISASDPAHTWSWWQRCIVIFRFDALMTGVMAAWLQARFPEAWRRFRRPCAVAGGLLVLWTYQNLWLFHHGRVVENGDTFFARTLRYTLISLGYALLLPWASEWRRRSENPVTLAVRRIAVWSYALYLVNIPWFYCLNFMGFHSYGPWVPMKTGLGWATVGLEFGGAIILGALLHRLIEKPAMDQRDKAGRWLGRRLEIVFGPPKGSLSET